MLNQRNFHNHSIVESGFSMIEVLVTIVIIAIGLLGLSGLHAKVSVMEMESYQRAQALALLEDMEDRIRGLRGLTAGLPAKGNTVTVGKGGQSAYDPVTACASFSGSALATCLKDFCNGRNGADLEICQWSVALAGASETDAGSLTLGAMIGARGCISSVTPTVPPITTTPPTIAEPIAEYYVTVVWQGLVATADPPANTYGSTCASVVDFGTGLRRFAVTRILVPYLDAL
jgi:type IV pilus assembly protein PilV